MNKSRIMGVYIIILIVSLLVFLASIGINVITVIDPNIFGKATTVVDFIVLVISLISGFGTVYTFLLIRYEKQFIEQLKLENTYTLGHSVSFYNLAAFKSRANKLMRIGRFSNLKKYCLVFTCVSLNNVNSGYRSEEITELNYLICKKIAEMFGTGKYGYNRKLSVYGYNRGAFLIFTFAKDDSGVTRFITEMSNYIFEVVKEKQFKIWAQPFYGLREVEEGDNLISVIEDALIARNTSEENFESFTKFIKKKENSASSTINFGEIEQALINNEFVPYYQPKFNLKNKEFCGCEVLARWNSPSRGLLSPGSFIDKAEQGGLISAIDLYIFEKALIDLKDSLRRGRRVVPVSCNFSLYEFFSHTFLDTITGLLQKYEVPPSLVEVEITETTSQVNQFMSVSVIKKLKDYGIRVLMDDYGVGYSQIQNLRSIPFDAIKIDKSFTDKLLTDEKTASIVKFLAELGHTNDMEVIIEGVENKEQVDVIRRMHVDTIQGFYYSKALPYNEFQEFLKNNPFESRGKKE